MTMAKMSRNVPVKLQVGGVGSNPMALIIIFWTGEFGSDPINKKTDRKNT